MTFDEYVSQNGYRLDADNIYTPIDPYANEGYKENLSEGTLRDMYNTSIGNNPNPVWGTMGKNGVDNVDINGGRYNRLGGDYNAPLFKDAGATYDPTYGWILPLADQQRLGGEAVEASSKWGALEYGVLSLFALGGGLAASGYGAAAGAGAGAAEGGVAAGTAAGTASGATGGTLGGVAGGSVYGGTSVGGMLGAEAAAGSAAAGGTGVSGIIGSSALPSTIGGTAAGVGALGASGAGATDMATNTTLDLMSGTPDYSMPASAVSEGTNSVPFSNVDAGWPQTNQGIPIDGSSGVSSGASSPASYLKDLSEWVNNKTLTAVGTQLVGGLIQGAMAPSAAKAKAQAEAEAVKDIERARLANTSGSGIRFNIRPTGAKLRQPILSRG